MEHLILRLNTAGAPVRWIPWQEAVNLYSRDMVVWTAGTHQFTIYGGHSRHTGERSSLDINSIIATRQSPNCRYHARAVPPLTNRELFRRDGHLCMYCGKGYADGGLTRDHVLPVSLGGRNRWSNVVSACRQCNIRKGGRTPEQANMALLAVPYIPNWAEYLALSNRRILADQMDFLKSQFKQEERLLYLQS